MTASASIHPECPRCGAKVAADAPEGLCVRCLAQLNLTADSIFTGAEAPRSEPPSLEEIAPHFPQLEVLACLGRGGMGVVYKARQKSLDRLVALKILAPEREKDPHFAERFAREAQALAKLSHPHIVTVYDFGQADGLFYLLMEYVDGVNLRQLLRTRRLEPKEALAIVPPICDALQYAHDHAVVHRDIKPENLLLDKAGQVKIADFGIAKMLGGDSTPDEEQGVGTPHYMAPEQHATPQAADHRADIYSLGVVLYEMLTGELPAGQFVLPSRKVQIDVRLDEIVLRALNREPELRFQQAGQLKTAVETLTGAGQEIGPEAPSSVSRANRSKLPKFPGTRATNVKTPIAITLVVLFLAASLGIFYMVKVRFSGNLPNARTSTFAEEAKRGSDAFERGDYDQAIVAWDEAIRINPNHSNVHRWRGDASLNKFELDKALSEYAEALRLDPNNGVAYCGRGAALMGKGEFEKAIASFDQAIRLDPEIANLSFYKRFRTAAESLHPNPRNSTFAEAAESLHPHPRNSTFAEEAKRGSDAFERGDFDQAIVAWDEAIRLDPNHSEAHRWRGDAWLNKHEFDKALSEYDEAIRLDKRNAMAYSGRGAAFTGKGEFDKAIACFDLGSRRDPKLANKPFYKRYRTAAESFRRNPQKAKFAEAARRGFSALQKADFDQAIVAFDELIRLDPTHSEAHRWRGDASLNKHEPDKALSEYDEAIRLDPKNGMAYCGRGAALTGKGDFDKAIASFDLAIRLDPEIAHMPIYKRFRAVAESLRPNPRNLKFAEAAKRGSDAFERGDYDHAIVAWDEAIGIDPNDSEAHRWRGDASLNKHELDKALSEYDEAIRLDPKNGMAYCCRGAALTGQGEYDKAIASFDLAIRHDPKIASLSFYKRYRAAAELPRSFGLPVVVGLLTISVISVCLILAFGAWSSLRHRKPEADKDF